MALEEFQAWGPPDGPADTFSTVDGIRNLVTGGLLPAGHVHLFSIRATSFSEAMQEYHRAQGWDDYKQAMPDNAARTGSGKQILLQILADLSTRQVSPDQLSEATQRLRAGLLLHGSTADESFEHARRLAWRNGVDEKGSLWRQGIATASTNYFLTDILESIREMPGLEEFIRGKHPGLTSAEYQASEWALWLIVSSVQMYVQLLEVESDQALEIDSRVENYSRIFRQHCLERGVDPDAE